MSQTDTHPPVPGEPTAPAACARCGAPLRPDQDWCLNCGAAVTTEVAGAPAWRTPIAIVGAVLAVAAVALVLAFLELSDDAERVAQAPTPTPTPAATAAPPSTTPTPDPAAGTATPAPTTPPEGTATASPTPDADGLLIPTPQAGGTGAPGDGTAKPGDAGDPAATPDAGGSGGATGGSAFADWPAGRTAYTVILWSATSRSEAETKARQFEAAGEDVGILNSSDYASLRPGYFVVFSGQYDSAAAAQRAAQSAQSTAPGAYVRRVKPD